MRLTGAAGGFSTDVDAVFVHVSAVNGAPLFSFPSSELSESGKRRLEETLAWMAYIREYLYSQAQTGQHQVSCHSRRRES